MGKIRIVTDSSAQFVDPGFPARAGVIVVPQTILIGAARYQEGVTLDSAIFSHLAEDALKTTEHEAPQHVAPTTAQFIEVYGGLLRGTDQVIALHVSRGLSKTWDHAQEATRSYLGRMSITVLDSMTTSVGLGLLVEEAVELASSLGNVDLVSRELRKRTQNVYAVFYTEAFQYLERNGLLSASHAALGDMLAIKPFVTIEDGQLATTEKARNRTQVVDKLVEFAAEFEHTDRLFILHGGRGPSDLVRQVQDRLMLELGRPSRAPVMAYCPTLATFIGPDALGLIAYHPRTTEST
jgi:DegV family protein with EDD domain